MKSEDELFDEFLRSKLGNEKFELKDQYWQNARRMIDEKRPAKKRAWFVFIMPVMLLLTGATLFFNKAEENKKALNKTLSQTSGTNISASNDHATSKVEMPANSEMIKQKDHSVNRLSSPVFLPSAQAAKSNVQTSQPTPETTGFTAPETSRGKSSVVTAKSKKAQNNRLLKPEPLNASATGNEMQLLINTQQNDEAGSDAVRYITPAMNSVTLLPRWKKNINVKPAVTQQIVESGTKDHIKPQARNKASFFQLEAGATYYNPVNTLADNVNTYIKASFHKPVSPRLIIGAGLAYSRIHQSNGLRTYDVISYGFGETRKTIGINTIRLDYIELPVSVTYLLKERHRIGAGASFGYILSSSDLIKQQHRSSFDKKAQNYYDAFNRTDVQLFTSYAYSITPQWFVTGAYYYGITDITKNKPFKSSQVDNNRGMRLGLGYQF